ncbi:MAG: DUF6348 family protein [Byssovorax sp.]
MHAINAALPARDPHSHRARSPFRPRGTALRAALGAGALVLLLGPTACSKPTAESTQPSRTPEHTITPPVASTAARPELAPALPGAGATPPSDAFFADWLTAHGETRIVVDAGGVGLANNPTRFRTSRYGVTPHGPDAFLVESEFRVRVPGGGEIIEYVAGVGSSPDDGENDARANFVTSTLHVIYRSFLNPRDPHQTEETVSFQGTPRAVVRGDLYCRSFGDIAAPDLAPLDPKILDILRPMPLSPGPHWIKLVFQQASGAPVTVAATLDNNDDLGLTAALGALPWPKRPEPYLVKQFIVVK